jgi:glycerol-3-phosphate O-acyltransferase
MYELYLSSKQDFRNTLLLAYYKNTVIAVFLLEAFFATALSQFGH